MGMFRKKSDDGAEQVALAAELTVVNDVLRTYPAGSKLSFGAPTRCPQCANFGFVQNTNHAAGTCTTNCLSCHISWVITARALKAYATATRPQQNVPGPTLGRPFAPLPEPDPEPVVRVRVAEPAPAPPPPPVTAVEPEPIAPPSPAPAIAPAAEVAPVEPEIDLDHEPLRVLVVEDNPFDLATLEGLLAPFSADEVILTHAATRAEGQEATRFATFDVIVLDLDLPDSSGITTVLEWQHDCSVVVPIIATAQEADAALIQEARALGVVHVVQKAHLDQLASKGEVGSNQLMKLLRTTADRGATTKAPTPQPGTISAF